MDILPTTAVVALILFAGKESILEPYRRFRENKNQKLALDQLLSEEMKRNRIAALHYFSIIKSVIKMEESPNIKCRYLERGEAFLFIVDDEGAHARFPFPRFSLERYERYALELAKLDQSSYLKVSELYSSFFRMNEKMKELLYFIDRGKELFTPDEREFQIQMFEDYSNGEKRFSELLSSAYFALTNEDLEPWPKKVSGKNGTLPFYVMGSGMS